MSTSSAADAAQERLWITEPGRATCLATVTAVRGDAFCVDRALFAPRSRDCRHPQVPDKGRAWWDGDKRRLGAVFEQGDKVWYRLRGTVPDIGVELQCELDQEWRRTASRAHTAMHLLLAALPRDAPPMVVDPEIKGDGHFRLTFQWPVAPPVLAKALEEADRAVARDMPVAADFMTAAEAQRACTPQAFSPPDPVPGGDVVPVVRIGDSAYPCDGTHVDRTGRLGRIVVAHARQRKEGFVVVGRVRSA